MTPVPAGTREQTLSLARVFLARFFDNEITGGTNDLTEAFFWLVAFLAIPGMFASVMMSWGWGLIARVQGPDALRLASATDKVFYLSFTMIVAGFLTSIVWHSLLVDRRDALVLGTLPVSHRVIVQAKLLAIAAYVALVAVAMHVLSSIGFGLFLSAGRDVAFAARGLAAHFVASALASLFVLLVAIAAQATLLAAVGPRGFKRLSPLLQLLLVATVVLGLVTLPQMCAAVVDTLRGAGTWQRPWILATPPMWFFGIYEAILGTDDAILIRLARSGWIAFGAAAAIAALVYPLAYRRVMRDAVEHPEGSNIGTVTIARWLPPVLGRRGAIRAGAQFFLATAGRVERHRLAIALSCGVAVAWGMPVVFRWRAIVDVWSDADQRLILALPFATMAFVLAGLRIAASLPGDLGGRWIFRAIDAPQRTARSAIRRVLLAVVVLPVTVAAGLTASVLWRPEAGVRHAAVCFGFGWLLTECLVSGAAAMPCAAPWRPENARLRTRWPAYLLGFILLCGSGWMSLSGAELASLAQPAWNEVLIACLALSAVAVHWTAARRTSLPDDDVEALSAPSVLHLS